MLNFLFLVLVRALKITKYVKYFKIHFTNSPKT